MQTVRSRRDCQRQRITLPNNAYMLAGVDRKQGENMDWFKSLRTVRAQRCGQICTVYFRQNSGKHPAKPAIARVAENAILTFGNISDKDFDALVADLARKAGITSAAG